MIAENKKLGLICFLDVGVNLYLDYLFPYIITKHKTIIFDNVISSYCPIAVPQKLYAEFNNAVDLKALCYEMSSIIPYYVFNTIVRLSSIENVAVEKVRVFIPYYFNTHPDKFVSSKDKVIEISYLFNEELEKLPFGVGLILMILNDYLVKAEVVGKNKLFDAVVKYLKKAIEIRLDKNLNIYEEALTTVKDVKDLLDKHLSREMLDNPNNLKLLLLLDNEHLTKDNLEKLIGSVDNEVFESILKFKNELKNYHEFSSKLTEYMVESYSEFSKSDLLNCLNEIIDDGVIDEWIYKPLGRLLYKINKNDKNSKMFKLGSLKGKIAVYSKKDNSIFKFNDLSLEDINMTNLVQNRQELSMLIQSSYDAEKN